MAVIGRVNKNFIGRFIVGIYISQSSRIPCLPSICTFHHANAVGITRIVIPSRDIDDITICRVNGNTRNSNLWEVVGKGSPICSVICGFPNASRRCANVESLRILWVFDYRIYTPLSTNRNRGIRHNSWTWITPTDHVRIWYAEWSLF